MTLLTISQAAQRIGTDEQTICHWIEMGLLTPRIEAPQGKTSQCTHNISASLASVATIDPEELDEIAESEGWLLVASRQGAY